MVRLQRRAVRGIGWMLCASAVSLDAIAATQGRVIDLNGQALDQAMVTLTRSPQARGPTALTVFTDERGAFTFPADAPDGSLSVRLLGYSRSRLSRRLQRRSP